MTKTSKTAMLGAYKIISDHQCQQHEYIDHRSDWSYIYINISSDPCFEYHSLSYIIYYHHILSSWRYWSSSHIFNILLNINIIKHYQWIIIIYDHLMNIWLKHLAETYFIIFKNQNNFINIYHQHIPSSTYIISWNLIFSQKTASKNHSSADFLVWAAAAWTLIVASLGWGHVALWPPFGAPK